MIEATVIQAPVIQAPVNEAMPSTKRPVNEATIVIIPKKQHWDPFTLIRLIGKNA